MKFLDKVRQFVKPDQPIFVPGTVTFTPIGQYTPYPATTSKKPINSDQEVPTDQALLSLLLKQEVVTRIQLLGALSLSLMPFKARGTSGPSRASSGS